MNESEPSFIAALFDVEFKWFVTRKWIRFLYIIFLILSCAVLSGLLIVSLMIALKYSLLLGMILAVISFLVFVLELLYTRMICERMIVIFNIERHTAQIKEQVPKQGNRYLA